MHVLRATNMPGPGAFALAPAPASSAPVLTPQRNNVPRQSFEVADSTADSAGSVNWANYSADNILAKRQAVKEVFLEESRKITHRRRYVAAAALTGLGIAAFFFFFFFFPL